jgi:uncharacterized protein (TIGR00255 family)
MTGYASASVGTGSAAADNGVTSGGVSVEMRSVNGRFLDLAFRIPDELRGVEPAVRELIAAAFRRGKVEVRITTQRETDAAWPAPTSDQLNRLASLETTVQGWLPKAQPLSVHEALNWCRGASTSERLDEPVVQAAQRCIAGLRDARRREGERLVAILMERVQRLRELATQATPLVPQAVERQQQRFLERWNDALQSVGAQQAVPAQALAERALNEAAAYALRIDVAEELSRLSAHLDEITRLLEAGGEVGKKLDFLIQELHREANTLGSKSSALDLTNISVEMKVAIEQMREQVQNLE